MSDMVNDSIDMTNTLDSVVDKVDVLINKNPSSLPPSQQYDPTQDPESEENEAFNEGYDKVIAEKFTEGFSINAFLQSILAKNPNATTQDIASALASSGAGSTAVWYSKHPEEIDKKLAVMQVRGGVTPIEQAVPTAFDPSSLKDTLAKQLVSAVDNGVDKVMTAADTAADKFDQIYDVATTILQGRGIKHHAFIYGSPGIGKTYSVKQAVKNEFSKGGLAHKGYNINMKSGDIGRSISALVAFFYFNRQKQVIILDDCDGFVLNKDQTVQNLLKALLDLDNTEKNPKYVSVAPAIQDLATKYLGQVNKKKKEGVVISIDHEKLRENLLSVAVDGVTVGQSLISNEEKRMFKPVVHESVENDDYDYDCLEEGKNLDAFIAAGGDPNSEDADMAAEMDENDNLINDGNDDDTVPEEFRFTSRLIMISNLKKSDVNDAVLSRTLSYDMELTKDEFLAHLGDILPNLITDVETEDPDWMIQYAKKVAYAYLIAAVDIDNAGGSVQGVRCKITIPLQFRIIAELAGKWCMRANRFITKNNLDYSEKSLPKVDKAIRSMFFVRDVIPSLQA